MKKEKAAAYLLVLIETNYEQLVQMKSEKSEKFLSLHLDCLSTITADMDDFRIKEEYDFIVKNELYGKIGESENGNEN